MDLAELIDKLRKEHVLLQEDRRSIHQLNKQVNDEIESTIKSMWTIKNQRYICDNLYIGHKVNDPITMINEFNKIQHVDFTTGHQKFGSNEMLLSNMLQYLRDNPKSISYLLFFAEKECSNFLELICKIVISTVYNHCFLDQDKLSLIDMMEELIEIYINFHDDLRRHLHSKSSSFGIVYRNFCDEHQELKTFYKLALTEPIMLVLSEDNLYLDIDSSRAVMRFCQEERQKHFGPENSPSYQENMARYRKWTIKKLKHFVNNFIRSLKANIYAFPQSLILLMIRMYAKLIERFEYQKVNTIFNDMIFFFLICPAIQNPDLFGITDLHINHIAQYNLMQCAQIIQMLALSNWERVNMPYQEICNLFDRNCLTFIIDHIFSVAKSSTNKSKTNQTIEVIHSMPHFIISDIELKFLLEYINLFLTRNDLPDQPLSAYYRKLPESILNFEYENKATIKSDHSGPSLKSNKSSDFLDSFDTCSSLNIRHILANNSTGWPISKVLFNVKQIFKICNYNFQQEQTHFIGLKSEEKLLSSISKEKRDLILSETVDKILKEIDELINLEIGKHISSDSTAKFVTIDEIANNIASLLCLNNETSLNENVNASGDHDDAHELITTENSIDESFETAEMNMQSLGTLTLFDFADDHIDDNRFSNRTDSPELIASQTSINKNPVSKKVLTGIKSIKDKMKNTISLKDNKLRITSQTSTDQVDASSNINKIDLNTVKAETDEIFGKYRSAPNTFPKNPSTEQILIDLADKTQSYELEEVDQLLDIQSKLKKLISTIDISHIYRRYRFLNLSDKNDFIKLLKILLSQYDLDSKEMSTTVLIMDILRILHDLPQEEFSDIFVKIETDSKSRNFYKMYLLKCRQCLNHRLQQFHSVQTEMEREHVATDFIIISFLVRIIMEKYESNIHNLIYRFRNASTLQDEKASLVKTLINKIINDLQTNFLTDQQLTLLYNILERHLMNRIYLYAFFPNGDIDHMRDQILHQQIEQLSLSVSHNSKYLNIPSKYFNTSPWPSAQAELLLLSAYKTPRDKVQCIYRCCSHIITLLGTSQNSIPSADDLLPVLIFVVIKANPKSILSTIQYVNTFYSNDMPGEESYYWIQFCSAVEFIKTILQ